MLYTCTAANTTGSKYGLALVAQLPPLTEIADESAAEPSEARRTRRTTPFRNSKSTLLEDGIGLRRRYTETPHRNPPRHYCKVLALA